MHGDFSSTVAALVAVYLDCCFWAHGQIVAVTASVKSAGDGKQPHTPVKPGTDRYRTAVDRVIIAKQVFVFTTELGVGQCPSVVDVAHMCAAYIKSVRYATEVYHRQT